MEDGTSSSSSLEEEHIESPSTNADDKQPVFRKPLLRANPKKVEEKVVEGEEEEESNVSSADAERMRSIANAARAQIVHQQHHQDVGQESEPSSEDDAMNQLRSTTLYNAPMWGGDPVWPYKLDVLKGGAIVESVDISKKEYYIVGRQAETCDIVQLHPSLSRQHAVIQHRDDGTVYVYDLGSTHNTFIGKQKLKPRTYYILRIGDMIKFGASTRMLILQGPEEAQLHEQERLAERARQKARRDAGEEDESGSSSCGWGFGEDATEEPDDVDEEDESEAAQKLKKLRQRHEDEQLAMGTPEEVKAYMKKKREEAREGKFKKKKKNPNSLSAEEEEYLMKRAEEELQANEQKKRLAQLEEWDESFDDGDDFYDRAGGRRRTKLGAPAPQHVETLESLKAKLAVLLAQKELLERDIEKEAATAAESVAAVQPKTTVEDDGDSLESFMTSVQSSIGSEKVNKKQVLLKSLEAEVSRMNKLLVLAQPAYARMAAPTPTTTTSTNKPDEENVSSTEGEKRKQPTQALLSGISGDVERMKQKYLAQVRREDELKKRIAEQKEKAASNAKRKLEEIEKDRIATEEEDVARQQQQAQMKGLDIEEDARQEAEMEERRKAKNKRKREKREKKKRPRFDDEAGHQGDEQEEQGYGYSEWVPPASAVHYTL